MIIGILDGHTIQALIFSKKLRNQGHKVILFCSDRLSYGYFTRYANKKILSPSSEKNTNKYHDFIVNFLDNNHVDVLIPMNDYSAKYLSKYKPILSKLVNFLIPNYNIFMKGYDKNKLMKICNDNNFPHPKTLDLEENYFKLKNIKFKFPALIKPNETSGARGFAMIKSFAELDKLYPDLKKQYGNCHLQEFIPKGGKQFKVQILMYKKNLVYSTVIEKHRYYPIKGGSSCFNSTVFAKELVSVCFKVLNKIEWEGFADFDLIEDPRDGRILIMEINPRVPACIKASIVSGIDFPNLIADLSIGKNFKKYIYKPGKFLRYFSLDLLWLIKSEYKLQKFNKWKKNIFSKNHYLQDGDWFDPLPFF
jgi:predicted ATP-grasp superfamily ATP-dependent carboligase